ncbi:MAG: serpin family protein, partial [Planctomycetota bacterium]
MEKLRGAWAIPLALVVGCAGSDIPPEPPVARLKDPEARSVAESVNAFALDLYAELKGGEGNLFLSPYSISTALAMTYAGARGGTAFQMANCLHFTLGRERLHPAFKRLIDDLNARAGGESYRLSVANALWGQKDRTFIEEFTRLLEDNYAAGMKRADFENDADSARREINAWVEKETRGRIKDLIGPGVLDGLTRLVLANAVHFKGAWLSAFREHNTYDRDFTLHGGGKVKVRMMYRCGGFWYREFDGLQVLELPYRGDGLSMVVLLPAEHDGLGGLEETLTERELGAWLGRLRWREVIVHLPK